MLTSFFRKQAITSVLLIFSSSFGVAQESRMSLATRADENVQSIFNTLATQLLKKTQWADDSAQITLAPDSAMSQGEINGQFVLNSSAELATSGQISTILTTSGSDTHIMNRIIINTTPKFFYDVATASVGTPITSLTDFKAQVLQMVTSLSSTESRQTMSFDGSSPTQTALDPNQTQAFLAILESGMQVSSANGEEMMTLDMVQIKSAWEPLADTLPQLQWLAAMSSMEVHASASAMTISINTSLALPLQVITNYDAYLSNQQATVGLASLNELIQSIGGWAIRRCSTSDYYQECINKILKECPTSTDRIAGCVSQAENIRGLVDAKQSGDILGVIRFGTAAAAQAGVDWAVGE